MTTITIIYTPLAIATSLCAAAVSAMLPPPRSFNGLMRRLAGFVMVGSAFLSALWVAHGHEGISWFQVIFVLGMLMVLIGAIYDIHIRRRKRNRLPDFVEW
jgi:hypothetical protein